MLFSSITKNSLLLGVFALVTTTLLAVTAQFTSERISTSEREAQQKALFEIVPRERHDNDILTDIINIPQNAWVDLGLKNGGAIHVARQSGKTIAVIVPAVAPDGYSGDIHMIIGVNVNGTIAGVRVVDHHETPGLGDKIDLKKSHWILGFNDKSIATPKMPRWKVKKDGGDFDQFAGATITPRAVVNQVKRVLEFVEAHRGELFEQRVISSSENLLEHNPATLDNNQHVLIRGERGNSL
ncbi:MAG: electron transport complex subunit RsxG [Moraxellaceae bacterium]|nr:MAG: electron transport complex subunit RsxG [Moraxellaceae bacterium]